MDELDPADAVAVAYVNQNEVTYSWHHSMIEMIGYDMAHKGRILQGGYIAIRHGSGGLVEARNKAIKSFLSDGKAEWLFWVDTDMGFAADTIDRLMEVADPVERPIVGGLCFSQRETYADGMGGWRAQATPTIYDWAQSGEQQGFAVRWNYQRDTVQKCAGTGSACILIHRSVFERIAEKFGSTWYNRVPNASMGEITSEDLSFCMHAGAVGIPVHVHTGVKTTHQKLLWLSENDFLDQSHNRVAPPATEQTAILVPVMKRPQNAKPFMESLRASTGMANVYAICDGDDEETAAAWREAGARLIEAGQDSPGTFAEKVNTAYAHTAEYDREPWLFLCGDDVRFHPGWLDQAQAAAGERFHVVGTNDLANPRVTSGQHSCHLLIRRSYVDEHGASWDGPGIVAHEGYRHWYVDDEIVTAAKLRGVWAMAIDSIVPHLHPLFGGAENDEVYELGQSHAAEDKALFEKRVAEHAS